MIDGQRHDLAEVKRTYPLPDVLEASGLVLRRGGDGVFWARCPFHADTTPSFFVDVRAADDPHFHCFGCRAHGDVIDFVRLRNGLATIGEALTHLTGTPPPPAVRATAVPPRSGAIRARRWDHLTLEEQLVLNTTVTLYQHALWNHPPALAYLRGRGFSDGVLRRYGLGYADGHSLEGYLRRHGGLRIAEHLSLLRRPEPGEGGRPLRERFAGRIVVPELRGGQPIWLIGRRPDDLNDVKYLSLPGERPILGLERVVGRREAFLAEGVFDWLTAVSWGLPAFSSCGTALPPERLGWLARAHVVWGVLDADRGGREGAARFGAALGRCWRPLALPEGCDLNDLGLRPGGRVAFFRLLHTARLGLLREGATGVSAPRGPLHREREPDMLIRRSSCGPRKSRAEERQLRIGVLHLGALLGWDARAVARFAAAAAGCPWPCCGREDLLRILFAYDALAHRVRATHARLPGASGAWRSRA